MSIQGVVSNGAIVLENPLQLPDGTKVIVSIQDLPSAGSALGEMLLRHAGKAQD